MAEYIYQAQMDIPDEHEAEFNRLYDEEHVPEILTVPGVKSCRRYLLEHSTVDGVARYMSVYEIESPEVIKQPEWREAADRGDWKPNIRPHTQNRLHCVYRRIL